MNENYLSYICCPKCTSNIIQKKKSLICEFCGTEYAIINGIPVLVDLENLSTHFSSQIQFFENDSTNTTNCTKYVLYEWQKSYIDRFRDNFDEIKGKVVLDCGTGSGYMAIELAKMGANVIACDLTLKSLFRLQLLVKKEKIENQFTIVCCSADKLPIKSIVVDYYISNAVLEHIPGEENAISEVDRVTKSKSNLMITVPLSYKFINPLLIPVNFFHDKQIGHLRRYDIESLMKKFQNWNYQNVYYTGHFSKVLKVLINRLFRIFNEKSIEENDRLKEKNKWGANNIIVMFNKCGVK